MLRVFCFGSLGVTVEDLYFVDPRPHPESGGQDGHERGVRVELRVLDRQPWRGSPYASQRVVAEPAAWRVDLLESVAGGPGTRDRMHHHPGMKDGEPGGRVFVPDLNEDPVGWLETRLGDVVPLLEAAGVPDAERHRPSADELRAAVPEVTGTIAAVLADVRAGRLATSP